MTITKIHFLIKTLSILSLIALLTFTSHSRADIILLEDFENAAQRSYQSNINDALTDIANSDYYGQTTLTNLPNDIDYKNVQGTGFYAVQDTDGALPQAVDHISLSWLDIDISQWQNLLLSWFIAEDDDITRSGVSEDFDSSTRFSIEIQLDNAGFFDIFAVEGKRSATDSLTNQAPAVDTDFDGVGDGVEITDSFSQFDQQLAQANELDIRVNFSYFDAADEDFAFDQLVLSGDRLVSSQITSVPEPTTGLLMLLAIALMISTVANRKAINCGAHPLTSY